MAENLAREQIKKRSDLHESNSPEIVHDGLHVLSTQGFFAVWNEPYLRVCRQAPFYQSVPLLVVNQSHAFYAGEPAYACMVGRILV